MPHWSVRAQFAVPQVPTDDHVDELLGVLAEHGPAILIDLAVPTIAVRLDVTSSTVTGAVTAAARLVVGALALVGIDGATLDAVGGQSYEDLDRELAHPQVPPLVGAAEIADMLGVSRQRVYELAARPDFPGAVQDLAAGKVYLRSQVEAFNAAWPRKRTGRPRKVA